MSAQTLLAKLRPASATGFGRAAVLQTLFANFSIQALNVLTGILTARSLGPPGRGELAAMIMWPQFLAFCLAMGIPSAVIITLKSAHPDGDRKNFRPGRLFAASVLIGFLLGLIAALVGFVMMPYWLRQYPPATIRLARIFVFTAPAPLLNVILASAFQVRGDFTRFNLLRFLAPLLTLVLLAASAATGHLAPIIAACCFVIPPIALVAWAILDLSRSLRPSLTSLHSGARELLRVGLPFYGNDLLGMLSSQLDRVFVVSLLSGGETGVYVVAVSLAQVVAVLPTAVASVLFPKACGRPTFEVVTMVGRAARLTGLAAAAAAVAVGLFGPAILEILYGKPFSPAIAPARVLLAEAVLSGGVLVLGQAFMAAGRAGMVMVVQGVGVAVSFPLLVALVPKWGMMGAAVAMLIATIARLGTLFFCFRWVLGVRLPRLVPAPKEVLDLARAAYA